VLLVAAPAAVAAGTGSISGTVTEFASKTGLEGIAVEVLSPSGEPVNFAFTEASGKYKVPELAGGSYEVRFVDLNERFGTEYYKEQSTLGGATPVQVAEGLETTEINAALKRKISGTVTELAGNKPIEGVRVEVSNLDGEFEGEATTNAEGKYEVVGLEPGKYKVGFNPFAELNYVPQYYNDQPSFGTAEALPVEGNKSAEANAALQVGGEILGRVTDAHTGAPVAHIFVVASKTEGFEGIGFGETNSNGEYRVVGLATGLFALEFLSEPGEVQYINKPDSGVVVHQGLATSGINVALIRKIPVNTAPPVLLGAPAVGQPLFCTTGSWTGVEPITFTYAWLRDGTVISGAAGPAYVVQPADQGHEVTCRITAANSSGRVTLTLKGLKVPAAPASSSPPPPPPPNLENVSQSHSTWREGNKLASYSRKKKAPVGTTFKFVLNQQAVVSFAFTQQVVGRKVKGKCVAQTNGNRRKPSCKRTVTQGILSFSGHSGLNTVSFQGRISSSKKLAFGTYALVITATNATGQSAKARLNFTIVK
jgi:hypothetical protein